MQTSIICQYSVVGMFFQCSAFVSACYYLLT